MRFIGRSLTGLLLLAVTLGLIGLAAEIVASALRERAGAGVLGRPNEERVVSANVIAIVATSVTPRLTAFGEVQSRRTLELRAKGPGTIVWMSDRFQNGVQVAAGDLLLRFDPTPANEVLALAQTNSDEAAASRKEAEAAVLLAEGDLAAALAQAVLRDQALTRQKGLVERGVGSPQAVEIAELAVSGADQAVLSRRQAIAAAEARVDQAIIQGSRTAIALAEAQRAVTETGISAEFGGLLDGVNAQTGAVVGGNEVLGRIIDPDHMDVAMRLSTAQFALLSGPDGAISPSPAQVTLGAGLRTIAASGHLDRVAASVGAGQTGRLVYVAMDPAPGLRPGDFVTVEVTETPLDQAMLLPATAIGGNGTVLVVGREDRLEERLVDVLRRQGDQVIIGTAGLVGREIVAERSALLGAGIRIRPIRPEDAGAAGEAEMVELTAARRAELVAMLEANDRLPAAVKSRLLEQLQADRVPARVIRRVEARMGG